MNDDTSTSTLAPQKGPAAKQEPAELTLDVSAIDNIPLLEPDAIPILGNTVPAEEPEALDTRAQEIDKLDDEVEEMILDLGYDSDDSNQGSDDDFHNSEVALEPVNDNQITVSPDDELNYNGDDLFIDHEERRNQNMGTQMLSETASPEEHKPGPNSEEVVAAREEAITAIHNTFSLADVTPTLSSSSSMQASDVADFTPAPRNPAKDENPFLPKHLRERLNKSKQNLLEEITRSSEALNASSSLLKSYQEPTEEEAPKPELDEAVTQNSHKQIIDALIAQYLPIIEAELRRKLSKTLGEQKPRKFKPSFQKDK